MMETDSMNGTLSIHANPLSVPPYIREIDLMFAKNHDYGEAWRDMRTSSMTDLILMKLHRVKQMEDNNGVTLVSEGFAANYQDMLNYSVFALIKLGLAQK